MIVKICLNQLYCNSKEIFGAFFVYANTMQILASVEGYVIDGEELAQVSTSHRLNKEEEGRAS